MRHGRTTGYARHHRGAEHVRHRRNADTSRIPWRHRMSDADTRVKRGRHGEQLAATSRQARLYRRHRGGRIGKWHYALRARSAPPLPRRGHNDGLHREQPQLAHRRRSRLSGRGDNWTGVCDGKHTHEGRHIAEAHLRHDKYHGTDTPRTC